MRKKIVAGNWKMNKTLEEANILATEVKGMVADEVKGNVEVILCVPFPYLAQLGKLIGTGTRISVAAQNCSQLDVGARPTRMNLS